MSEQNKAQVRRVIEEIYNRGDLDVVDEVAASDLVIHAASEEIRGREGAKHYVAGAAGRVPGPPLDRRGPDRRRRHGGDPLDRPRHAHAGEFQGIPATGREVRVAGTDIDRIVDGKTVECWAHVDELGLMQQLGVAAAAG